MYNLSSRLLKPGFAHAMGVFVSDFKGLVNAAVLYFCVYIFILVAFGGGEVFDENVIYQ